MLTAKAKTMTALMFVFVSAIIGFIGGLEAPKFGEILSSWESRVTFGLIIFLILQFGLFTPFRMWRDAVWVQNIEQSLLALWDLHDEGVKLLNEHGDYMNQNPKWKDDNWTARINNALQNFSPADARRLKNLVTFHPTQLQGMNDAHTFYLNILCERLERLGVILERHSPSLLPE
jgi:hypothetical protein